MLRQLELTNFRKHEHLAVTFGHGLNAIKGANEAGKSTLILAVLYALYGSKALQEPLADVVTWGKKETDLQVKLTIEIGGRLFNFTRSKSGAEAEYDGGLVTGQNEVSNFAAEILGGDRELVYRLMFAAQSNLKGALEEGPKAVSTMIESLANFDLFDRIIDAAQQKLTLGSTAQLEERVRTLEEAANSQEPQAPDFAGFDQRIEGFVEELKGLNESVATLEKDKAKADAAYTNAQTLKRMRDTAESNLRRAAEQYNLHKEQKAKAEKDAAVEVDLAQLEALRAELKDAEAAKQRVRVFNQLQQLLATYPKVEWEGNKESFEAELKEQHKKAATAYDEETALRLRIGQVKGELQLAQASLITSSVCPTCGTDVSKLQSVIERNEAIQADIAKCEDNLQELQSHLETLITKRQELQADAAVLADLRDLAAPFEKFAITNGSMLVVDSNYVPVKLTWNGPAPEANLDPTEIQKRIVSLESAKEAVERANARSVALAQTIQEDEELVGRLTEQLQQQPEVGNTEELHDEVRRLGNEIANLKYAINRCNQEIDLVKADRVAATTEYNVKLAAWNQAKEAVVSARQELETLNFNNALLKKVRGARPLVADKLWGMTLSAVSTMFSNIRGEKSIVTKDKNGFLVNGKPVQGLSGSTLDILGLAIRVALIKTFLPHMSFMVLDEPAAGCDDNRTSALLGFIASTGFQAVVVSHEEATEAAANHVITL